ncbi:MAG: hypothetical protein WCW64_00565 [Phycisphaerae bacterium]|jgi:hypothetical protein
MQDEYWLKYGYKENGELVFVRTLSESEPCKAFFYHDGNLCKEVKAPEVVKLTKEIIETILKVRK